MEQFWLQDANALLTCLGSSREGLEQGSAIERIRQQKAGENLVGRKPWISDLLLLLSQYRSPLVILLVFAVMLSIVLQEYSESAIIAVVLLLTGVFGFFQERTAGKAVERLKQLTHIKACVKRNGVTRDVFFEEVVPGDILLLNAGDIVPGDAFLLESNDLHVNEAPLTGESFPVAKFAGSCSVTGPLSKITNAVFNGTSVTNGSATALVVHTGRNTVLGKIGRSLQQAEWPTAFEKGIYKFGYLLMYLTFVISGIILIINVLQGKPVFDSVLFALALAVGLTPELLPAIMTITLSAGAKRMVQKKVIVRKLAALQNLGEIDLLCCDKTGTITTGIMVLNNAVNIEGDESAKVLLYVYLNAYFQSGFSNPIDEAIKHAASYDTSGYRKIGEVPYDFHRKRLSVLIGNEQQCTMITKGAVHNILAVCNTVDTKDGKTVLDAVLAGQIERAFERFSSQGYRTLGICYKAVTADAGITKEDETDMTFLGLMTLSDVPKNDIAASINQLKDVGIALKIITGDNRFVAAHLAAQIDVQTERLICGGDMEQMDDDALRGMVNQVNVFAEVLPEQKERIVKLLRQTGHTVGYLGDGINDVNALRGADVGISIENAVDVAKEAADIVLLDRNIDVIREGVMEGRRTFENTMKYIYITISANFGNMISMAVASLVLPFLPILPVQILLNNFLSDLPAIALASDNVDKETQLQPARWNLKYIGRFMFVFGLQSSIFDFVTFGVLYRYFYSAPALLRTGWFMESFLSEIVILFVLRTRLFFLKSKPSRSLLFSSAFTCVLFVVILYTPLSKAFAFYRLPVPILMIILLIVAAYMAAAEVTKKWIMNKIR
ncbi:magnesium-translocating P-type ATPase [Niabella pedocola]|uniref:Magnesium-transporting ATPase, P-type 1 n=1 Tax=Niabella pedocola TaxID=1752077 RepID=A0ABS8PN22_9BACT|nr:magnesium-translocating P-type ATPase [Niabella pedocola]MCD2422149.1 magnesium-translocating P-type ATPase [Niabella pedocola]